MVRKPTCWYYNSRNASCPKGGADMFTVPLAGTYGNGSTLRNDGLVQFDLSVLKKIPFGDTRSLEFRGSFFNVFNHTTFTTPVTNIDSPSAGQITSTLNAARSMELAAKIYF